MNREMLSAEQMDHPRMWPWVKDKAERIAHRYEEACPRLLFGSDETSPII
jgi:hypothetical protein